MTAKDVIELLFRKSIEHTFMGDKTVSFSCFAPLDSAGSDDAIMVRQAERVRDVVSRIKPALVIVPLSSVIDAASGASAVIGVNNPRLVFALIQAEIHGPVMNQIGQYPEWVTVGKNCFIAPFCNIGGDGLNANYMNDGLIHTLHAGRVVIGDNVRVHSFTAVERAVLGETIVGHDCHIDYHCIIGHGVVMGPRCRLAPSVNLLGGVTVGDDVAIGAGAIINPGVKIGKGAAIGSGAAVIRDVPAGVLVVGNPAREIGLAAESKGATW